MKLITEETVSVVAEPGALTFFTRKEWQILPEALLDELVKHETVMVFKGTSSLFFLLRSLSPYDFMSSHQFKLVKASYDEDMKMVFYVMTLSGAEAEQLRRNRLTLWE